MFFLFHWTLFLATVEPMHSETVPTTINYNVLGPILRKILSKNSSNHVLRFDTSKNQIKLKNDKSIPGPICLESPFIALPNFDILKLLDKGHCCGYCGEVLKIYDDGKMKDDGKKKNRLKQNSMEKHDRYINGLDCSDCNVKWCDSQCRRLDFRHQLLHHRPTNKTFSHPFTDINGKEIDTFYFENWNALQTELIARGLYMLYNTILCIFQVYFDSSLKETYESLLCIDSKEAQELEAYIKSLLIMDASVDIKKIWEGFNKVFKNYGIDYVDFLRYSIIYHLNNYNGSIYLIFATLTKSAEVDANAKVEYYNGAIQRDYEEFSMVPKTKSRDLHIVKHHITDETKVSQIYTNQKSCRLDKKILEISTIKKATAQDEIILSKQDYTNPLDLEDDELTFLPDHTSTIPKIVVPISGDTNQKRRPSRVSFTSSGASFGEGIIKYNRNQIREMLESMTETIEKDELEEVIDDDNVSSVGSTVTIVDKEKLVNMVKNLQIAPHATQRRKSVKFDDNVSDI